ncbi:MAG: Lrp/AsnC family transcriptional regulator [Pelagibacteraceae bacterium]|jgi:Lrp/AsnC family transcriptional regulator|nr:Lrp/AsnC family transcriptional regulator [Pelagibacteraceae bacterium]MBT3902135.1 Lrp/AsnC family transcriptional regulator [Pelagibacteraceae bacterium]MBT4951536.1 Lrp/AsnC family transcriptional regulator [Pelagibacteraceae bacterium]
MDHIDKKIIEELQKNSSIPVSELSKKIGITTTPCWNRIKKLEEDKIIISKTISLDNNKINLDTTVFLSISIQNHKEEWLKNFEKVVNKYDEIIEVHRISGSNMDYQLTILIPSIKEYDIFQQKLIKEIECTNLSSQFSMNTIKKTNKLSLEYI